MREAAASIGGSYWTVRALVEAGTLPAFRLPGSKRFLIRMQDWEHFLERCPRVGEP
jgi:excisionase family DNA binding protein